MKFWHYIYLAVIILIVFSFSLKITALNKLLNECNKTTNFYIQELSKVNKEKVELLKQHTAEIENYKKELEIYAKKIKEQDKKIKKLQTYKVPMTDNECEDLKNALFELSIISNFSK